MKRGKRGPCNCNVPPSLDVKGTCRFGFCTEFLCSGCGRWRAGWGPVGCKCDGYIRWLWHPGMDTKTHVPVKPSIRKRLAGRR